MYADVTASAEQHRYHGIDDPRAARGAVAFIRYSLPRWCGRVDRRVRAMAAHAVRATSGLIGAVNEHKGHQRVLSVPSALLVTEEPLLKITARDHYRWPTG